MIRARLATRLPAWQATRKYVPRSRAFSCVAADSKGLARAVRAVKVKVITVSKGNSQGTEIVAGEWGDKIKRYTQFEHLQVKPNPKKAGSPQVAVQAEGEKVLKAIAAQDYVVLLDERGKSMTSEGMAKLIAKVGDNRVSNLVFSIGGPYGHSSEVRMRADEMVKLSDMVLNHQIAHLVLVEQIYRAWTILRGEPYHH
ncbi:hypothetical protein ABBQ32_013981 [Trebouxia sp. C0010 RCD-2024]